MGIKLNTIIFPFVLSEHAALLHGVYPDSAELKKIFSKVTETERLGIIRLWITEGIPFAFKDYPLLYEETREFISKGLNVNPKEITLVGSARIGYSLKKKAWGKAFSNESDLDFTIVSNDLYKKLVSDFQLWVGEFGTGKIIPNNEKQTENWLKSITTVNQNIPKGYINTKDLFSHNDYTTVKNCYRTMTKLKEKLEITKKSPSISDASIRVYSNWKNCVRQVEINFKTALDLW